jgi:RNA-directed DNA polymerase
MGVERQQGSGKQLDLFDEALKASLRHGVTGKGGTCAGTNEERQSPAAWAEKLALAHDVMEQVASSANLNQAYKRVKANKGAPGVDGMTVADLRDWIADNRERLIVSLLDGSYRPKPRMTRCVRHGNMWRTGMGLSWTSIWRSSSTG